MARKLPPQRLINEGPSFCARFSQIPVVLIFVFAIIEQTSVQIGSVRRLTQHQPPEIPTMPTRSNHSKTVGKKRKTRMIYGIMTYDSKSEQERRGLIRETFLSYFKNLDTLMNVTEEEYSEKKDWICSLNDLDHGILEHPDKCRMAYTFVQGANPNGTNMLLTFNESYPLSLPAPKAETEKDEKDLSDMIFLNIKENGKFGKSPTWFRYAIDVLERHGWMDDWDYIFKSDTDNLLYSPNFFRYVDKKLPRRKAQLVYGGLPLDYKKCGGDKHDDCKDMIGPYFMQGGCYFLSTELTRFIVNETAFDHQAVKLPHEDMTTGNFVYSHPEKIKVMGITRKGETIRNHPLKEERKFKFRWNKMLKEERARQNTTSVLDTSLENFNLLQLPARREE